MSELILSSVFPVNEQRIIRRAMRLLERYQQLPAEQFLAANCAKSWLQLYLARQEREVFVVLYLDNQHRLLGHETLFLGTINHTEIHPREIVKSGLRHNAAAVIVAHNHPSGITDASKSDRAITSRIVDALDWWRFGYWIISLSVTVRRCRLLNRAGCRGGVFMKIISKRQAMAIYRQHPESRLFRFCTGKYRWSGSVCHYYGRDVWMSVVFWPSLRNAVRIATGLMSACVASHSINLLKGALNVEKDTNNGR